MNVSFRQLHYVRTAAACRSISRAAERLHISQSSIGAAIDRVEHEYGVRAFIRQPSKGLLPTRSGQRLLQLISKLMADVDGFTAQASGLQNMLTGELNVGCFAPLAPHVLPTILRDLTQRHPAISVHFHEGHLRQVQEFLLEGVVDIALTYDLGLSDRISAETLGVAPPHVVLSPIDPLVKRESISLADLTDRPMILLDLPESRTYFDLLFQTIGSRPIIAHRTQTYEMVRSLVAAGLGYSILNLRPVIDQTYDGKHVVCRPISDNVRAPKFILGHRRHDFPTRSVKAFAGSCRLFFQSTQATQMTVPRRR